MTLQFTQTAGADVETGRGAGFLSAPCDRSEPMNIVYRDPVRSSKGHFVKASGQRWLSAMLLMKVPWADRAMALPFVTHLMQKSWDPGGPVRVDLAPG
jgi:hypothetical protein